MRKLVTFWMVAVFSAVSFSFTSVPSLDTKYVLAGTYDFSNYGLFALVSHSFGTTNLNLSLNTPIDFNYDSMVFSASLGFQLFRNQTSTFLTYLEFAKLKSYAFGLSGLFSNPVNGISYYGGVLYNFSDISHFVFNTGLIRKLSVFDINLGVILASDFQTELVMSPMISIDTIIGNVMFRLGYSYLPASNILGSREKHLVLGGIGLAPVTNLRYSLSISKSEYFEDEIVDIVLKRSTNVPVSTFGQITLAVVDKDGKEIFTKDYNIEQEFIRLSSKFKPDLYRIIVKKRGNFEITLEGNTKNSFVVKSVPTARIEFPSIVTRKQKYEVGVFVSSSDSYPSDISVRLDGREIRTQKSFVPNRKLTFELSIEELGKHILEVYANDRKIAQHNFEVRNVINAEWINQPRKVLTLQELALNPPKFRFVEILGNTQEPYSNQEVRFLIKKEGKSETLEIPAFTDRNGVATIPVSWENGIYLIEVKPARQEYTKITFSGRDDFLIRVEPIPKEMVLKAEEAEGVYIDEQRKVILISKDKRVFDLTVDIQDEIGDSVRSGFLKVTMFKVSTDGKLKDVSQDFNLTDRINLSMRQEDFVRIPVNISPRAETGEYYLFFEIYNAAAKEAQSRWVEVYKVLLYKEAILLAENLTIPGIVRKDTVFKGEPNKLKLVFMWKDGEPVKNLKVSLNYGNRFLEGYTNSEGEIVVLTPEPISDVFEFDFSISYDNFELASGTKKMKVETVERVISIPGQINFELTGRGRQSKEVRLVMSNLYEFVLRDENNNEILKGRASGYNLRKIFEEVYIPADSIKRSVVINLLDEQKNVLKINYSVYGIIAGMKGKEYFLGTFISGMSAQIPVSTRTSDGKEQFFDEFIIVPAGNYFVYRLSSLSSSTISLELRPARPVKTRLLVEDDEGTAFENPARYSIYYKERGTEYYVGSIMPGLDVTINIPMGLEVKDFINLLRVYRNGYQIDFDLSDVTFVAKENLLLLPVMITNQTELITDYMLEVTMNNSKIRTPYEIIAYSENTFYGIPLYSKTVYEKGRGKNFFGPTKNFGFIVYLPELGLNTYLEGIEISPTRTKLQIELEKLANITLCHFSFEKIQYQGVKAIIKVDGKEVWKETINKNATFPVSDGIHTIEVILDKYSAPIKIVKDFKKDTLGSEFKVELVKDVPNVPPYLHKDVLYYPKEDSVIKLYRTSETTFQLPIEIMSKVKYLKVEAPGTIFTLDNSYGFEKDQSFENRYKLIQGGREKQLRVSERNLYAIEFYAVDDDRIVLGFKPILSDVAENVSLIFKSFQDYATVGVNRYTEKLSDSLPVRFSIPESALVQLTAMDVKVKIHGYDKERKFILPLDISKLDRTQIVQADLVQVDGVVYTFSIIADPKIGNRTQRVILKEPGEYFVEYVGTNLKPLVIYLPDDLNKYQRGVDSVVVGP